MIPLFGESESDGKRDVLEGRLLSLALEVLPMSEADLSQWWTLFEEPDATELDGREIGGPPPGWPGWHEWAADRWPSFT